MKPRKCRKCGKTSAEVKFQQGKNLCNPCKSLEQKAKRHAANPESETGRPKRTLDLGITELPKPATQFDFSDPEKLKEQLPAALARGVNDLEIRVELNKLRVGAAIRSGYANDLKDAETAFGKVVDSRNAMLMRLADMVEGFGDREGGKDVIIPDSEPDEQANVIDMPPYEGPDAATGAG